jgi:host factor-I protein
MSKFDTGLPSVRQIQGYIKDQQAVEVKTITSDLLVGKLLWQDAQCLCLVDQYSHPTLVWRQAIVSLRPKA